MAKGELKPASKPGSRRGSFNPANKEDGGDGSEWSWDRESTPLVPNGEGPAKFDAKPCDKWSGTEKDTMFCKLEIFGEEPPEVNGSRASRTCPPIPDTKSGPMEIAIKLSSVSRVLNKRMRGPIVVASMEARRTRPRAASNTNSASTSLLRVVWTSAPCWPRRRSQPRKWWKSSNG